MVLRVPITGNVPEGTVVQAIALLVLMEILAALVRIVRAGIVIITGSVVMEPMARLVKPRQIVKVDFASLINVLPLGTPWPMERIAIKVQVAQAGIVS